MNPKLYCFACMHGLETEDQRCPRCGHDNRVRVNGKGQLPFSIIKNRYLIGKALGRGGFGVTYMGLDLSLDRRVAIKEYFPSELVSRETGQSQLAPYDENSHSRFIQGRERSMEEARTIARLNDVPAAVNVYDVFLANDTLYIVMEYIEGETLRARVKAAGGKLPAAAALTLLHPVFGALSQIHRQGIVHRDVSPDNIMLRASTGSAVLLDFGAAHSMELDAESEHSTSLRPGYAPVEQYSRTGLQDARTDEYALCATIYFAITGQKPVAAMERAFGEAPLPLPRALGADISPAAEAVLMKGLSVQAKDRYPDIATLEAALDAAMGGAVAPQPTVQPMPFMPRMQPTQPAYGPSDSGQTVAAQAVSAQSGSAQPPRPKKPLGLIVAFGVTACAMLAVLLVLLLKPGALQPGTAPTSTQSAAPATATAKATATATATATMAATPVATATPEATATPTAKAGVAPTPGWSYTNAPWASATPTAKAGLAPTPGWSYTNAPWASATPTAKAGLAPTPGWSYTNAPWATATPTAKAGLASTPGWSYTNAPWATATPAPTIGWDLPGIATATSKPKPAATPTAKPSAKATKVPIGKQTVYGTTGDDCYIGAGEPIYVSADGWLYTAYQDPTDHIYLYGLSPVNTLEDPETLVIPSEVDGYKVTRLDMYFSQHVSYPYNIRHIEIPDTLENLSIFTFPEFVSLETVTGGKGLDSFGFSSSTYAGVSPFYLNNIGRNLILGDGMLAHGVLDGSAAGLAARQSGAVTVPEGVRSIDTYAFMFANGVDWYCPVTSLTFPDSLRELKPLCLACFTGTSLTIPDNVQVGFALFYDVSGLPKLKDLWVGKNVTFYYSRKAAKSTSEDFFGTFSDLKFTGTLHLADGATLPTLIGLFGTDCKYTVDCEKGAILDGKTPKGVKMKYRK